MTKKILLSILVLKTICVSTAIKPAVGCLDDTLHVNECAVQRYTPVCCTCPCWRYKHSLDRNRCTVCLHYRDPETDAF